MTRQFVPDLLQLLNDAEEVEIAVDAAQPRRTIWIVLVDSCAYIRSVSGTHGHWYQELIAKSEGVLYVGSRVVAIHAVPVADAAIQARVSEAFLQKYGQYPQDAAWLTGPEASTTTLRLDPRAADVSRSSL